MVFTPPNETGPIDSGAFRKLASTMGMSAEFVTDIVNAEPSQNVWRFGQLFPTDTRLPSL